MSEIQYAQSCIKLHYFIYIVPSNLSHLFQLTIIQFYFLLSCNRRNSFENARDFLVCWEILSTIWLLSNHSYLATFTTVLVTIFKLKKTYLCCTLLMSCKEGEREFALVLCLNNDNLFLKTFT